VESLQDMKTETVFSALGGRFGRRSPSGREQSSCPGPDEVLDYLELRVRDSRRSEIESHLASCDDCRELLFAAVKGRQQQNVTYDTMPAEDRVVEQVELIRQYVERGQKSVAPPRPVEKRRRVWFGYPQLAAAALVACAIGLSSVFLLTRDEPRGEVATSILRQTMREGRLTEGWISELNEHGAYESTRGPQAVDSLPFNRALSKLKGAEEPGAQPADRLALARVRLAMGTTDQVAASLRILDQLSASTSLSAEMAAEVYNDMGVAQIQLQDYQAAIESLDKALARSPKFPQASFNRAVALDHARRYAESREAWQQFISIAPDQQWKVEAQNHLQSLDSSSAK